MTTRDKLEKAAKAAGLDARKMYDYGDDFGYCLPTQDPQQFVPWAPQRDHGQLHDLAMACDICLDPLKGLIRYEVAGKLIARIVDHKDFPALAEAVITAAAEQQKAKEGK